MRISDSLPIRQLLSVDEQWSKNVSTSCSFKISLILFFYIAFLDQSTIKIPLWPIQFAQEKCVCYWNWVILSFASKIGWFLEQSRNGGKWLGIVQLDRKCDAAAEESQKEDDCNGFHLVTSVKSPFKIQDQSSNLQASKTPSSTLLEKWLHRSSNFRSKKIKARKGASIVRIKSLLVYEKPLNLFVTALWQVCARQSILVAFIWNNDVKRNHANRTMTFYGKW